ncbi:MAG TPA: zinc ribbon domain-containing protein [Candidatus Borkfalkia faecavium]|uniref:Zinc ribbon domain-containing protein n=1 Tax=Candidatus Borkfalkia faecavium TaxID=2838508 RepID=A0A9D1VZV2_9FIRM|nr:zinc ribbon domain-containing protein [Candidatus Borkfalkia faecavium]
MYCRYCGKQIEEDARFCPYCGSAQQEERQAPPPQQRYVDPNDAPSGGFAVLGFFFPVVGLILFLVWQDTMPQRAKSCGKGALTAVIVSASLVLLTFIAIAVIAAIGIGMHGAYAALACLSWV